MALKKSLEADPDNDNLYFALGWLYKLQGRYAYAEELFKKAVEFNPNNDKACEALRNVYIETGMLQSEKHAYQKAEEIKSGEYNVVTAGNYHKLKEVLDARGIGLVCV